MSILKCFIGPLFFASSPFFSRFWGLWTPCFAIHTIFLRYMVLHTVCLWLGRINRRERMLMRRRDTKAALPRFKILKKKRRFYFLTLGTQFNRVAWTGILSPGTFVPSPQKPTLTPKL